METSRDQTVLVLEDEALIAIYLEELLAQAGFDSISTYSSCVAATEWLQQHTPELAVMETRLRDGACDEIAAILAKRGVPYIVHSVERDIGGRHPQMDSKCKWVDKPCNPDEFIRAVKECVPDHGRHML
ncbi:response regulator [Neorhizobium sp. CSC1952]|uniref:CheY chemotaxis protein or a CheY-like REC (Receiver) domain n=1 Tax=Xaviernesmea oryzae TaxID=464029 RepID=A0A1X7ETL4_9HYPH|nr:MULTISPECIES: response regulator [Rhizobium/Agrobacterium group]WJR68458.1 response regulator [Rhizobium sp. CSC1952]SMF39352.1 CheY chemotaxis protein or a CheY-like REC (receiver) domain [Xaviernesmea oryzae]